MKRIIVWLLIVLGLISIVFALQILPIPVPDDSYTLTVPVLKYNFTCYPGINTSSCSEYVGVIDIVNTKDQNDDIISCTLLGKTVTCTSKNTVNVVTKENYIS